MIIPEKIKILGLEWQIKHDQHVSDASEAYGTTVHRSQIINIEPTATQFHQEQTFFHEMLHAIWWSMGIHKIPDIDNKKEEQIIHALSNGLYQTLKDNDLLK